ncbi:non-ribosomal peptide synthase/polyketide synthase [Thermopolyspora sp. NPDC052614]|uniref:non-ribosomal peptide synthase/polyketide synthase n=1 Tax=Thermopolyspora sp. NPDC052614 TaxID=3155682 RepID=UPI00342AA939
MPEIAERLEMLRRWNNATTPATVGTVVEMFTAQVERSPEALALVASGVRLTYAELGRRVYQLAHHLLGRGLRAEEVVAVSTPRSAEMVIAVLAIMVAGGAFVPVDVAWPELRRRRVRAEAEARLVVAAPGAEPGLGEDEPVEVSLDAWRYGDEPAGPPRVTVEPGRLAYVMFTSGSTGTPKGAMIRHEAIGERLRWQVEHILGFGPGDASLFKAPLSFDISVNEILLPLVSGGYVVVAEPGGERDPQYLLDLIATEKVTFAYLVSSMLDMLLEMSRGTTLMSGLKHLWCGGEVLTPELFDRFRAHLPHTTLYHGYGPAEATIGVSHVIYRDSAERIATSIGRPNPHTQLYVLDDRLDPLPVGAVGELYAAGFLLGRGYVNAPALTASRFVANPFDGGGTRMYRTGDLARWCADGTLEFVGRADHQVKIRGMRLELEEVEAALAAHPRVRQAVVVVRESPSAARHLAGYVTAHDDPAAGDDLTADELRRWCAERLPEYMVPAVVMVLPAFPLTPNGKVDRRALPDPGEGGRARSREPRTAVERVLCDIFAEVLGVPEVGAEDDFFVLGGDSIVAIAVVRQARRAGLTVRPRDLLARRTPAALAPAVTPMTAEADGAAPDAAGPLPATPITEWLQDVGPAMDGFMQSMTVRTPPELTAESLEKVIDAVLATHDVLRTRAEGTPRWTLAVQPAGTPAAAQVITRVDVTGHDATALRAAIERETTAATRRLDPAAGRMIDVVWLDAGPRAQGRLVVVLHHVIVDGVSLRVLLEDLALAWDAVRDGREVALPPVPTSFRRWAELLRDHTRAGGFADDEDHWREVASAPDPMLGDRPLDPARDVVAAEESLRVELPADVSARLLGPVPAAVHGGVNDVLAAATALALIRWRAERVPGAGSAVLLEMEGHGREEEAFGEGADVDLSRTFGWFTTLFPVVLDPGPVDWDEIVAGGPALGVAVKAVKERLRRVPRNGLSYGALRYLGERPRPDLAVAPQVLFHYLGRFAAGSDGPWTADAGGEIVVERRDPRMPLPRVLEINAVALDTADGVTLEARFSWPRGVLGSGDVRALAALWTRVLTAMATAETIAGHTPSDFPLVPLSQADVTALERHLPDLTEILPLSPLQTGIYFHATFARDTDPYLVQQIIDLDGPLDPDRLRRAANRLIERHPNLGAAFRTVEDGRVVAVTTTGRPVPWRFADLSGLDADTAAHRLDAVADAERSARFDLSEPPAMRFALVRLGPRRHALIHTIHHILADGWSVPLLLRDLLALHRDPAAPEPTAHYREYLRVLAEQDTDAVVETWAAALSDVTEPTRLVAALPAPGEELDGFGRVERTVSADVETRLRGWAREQGVTVSAVIAAAWGILVGRVAGRTDVVFGSTVSGRTADVPGIESMIGLLINTIPARVRYGPGDPLADVVRRFADGQGEAMEHEHVPLARLQRRLGVPELFDTLVVVENQPALDTGDDELRISGVRTIEAPHYPVTLMVRPDGRIAVTLTHDRRRVDAATAERLLDQYELVLAAIADDPARACGAVELVPGPERGRLLAAGAGGEAETGITVLDIFALNVADHPDRVAVACGDTAFTYAELDDRAARVGRALAAAGVRRGDVVAVVTSRSADMATALLGVMRAGAAYLPIDPGYPSARIEYMLGDARPACVLADDAGRRALPPHDLPVVSLWAAIQAAADPGWVGVGVGPLDAVSVVYTSGSTGRPKAVVGTHGALVNRLAWARRTWAVSRDEALAGAAEPDVRVAKSSMSFIDGTTELLGGLVAGATMVIADDATAADGAALARLVERSRAGQLLAVPSLASALAETAPERLATVNRWICSGEALDASCVRALAEASPQARIFNSYGSSEVAGDVLVTEVRPGEPVTLGRPVPGTRVYLLDDAMCLVPPGAVGEIYVGGAQLARGYLGQGGATAARFVADPFGSGTRLYRTGDLGRWTPDGRIEFLGRADDQVKINGHRVEPAELEAALRRRVGVADAVVAARPTAAGGHALHAYVTAEPGEDLDPNALRVTLRAELPAYLIPATITVLERLPLLPNGKRDRRALPDPEPTAKGGTPRTAREALIVARMAAVLETDGFGVHDDFFALGGDSVLAIRVVNLLAREGIDLTTHDVFRLRTPAAIAAHLGGGEEPPAEAAGPYPGRLTPDALTTVTLTQEEIDAVTAAAPAPIADIWALSPLQQGVYYQATFEDGANTYIAQNVFDLDRRVDVEAMTEAFAALLRRHPTLRAGFTGDGVPGVVQYIAAEAPAVVAVTDLSALSAAEREAALDELMRRDREEPFDLTRPPLIRLTVVRLPAGRDRLLLTAHFLLWDGWSRELVLRELFTLYGSRGHHGALPDPADAAGASFTDYLTWLAGRDREASAQAWRRTLADLPEPTILAPEAIGREPVLSERVLAALPAEVTTRLTERARRGGVTLNSLLTVALGLVLGYQTGRTDVVFGTTVAGRPTELPGIENVIGLFLNTVPARVTPAPAETVLELARRVQADRLDLAPHEYLGLGDIQRATGHEQLFDTLYVLQNFLSDTTFTDLEQEHGIVGVDYTDTTHYPFTWVFTPGANLRVKLEYRPDVVSEADARRQVRRLVRLLEAFADGLAVPVGRLDALLDEEQGPLTGHEQALGDETIADMLAERARACPGEVALVFHGRSLTYAELDARINRFARLLLARGAGPGRIVALALPRGIDMVVALFAVLRTGGAYLPLDLDHPVDRLATMIDDARPVLLVHTRASAELAERMRTSGDGLVTIDDPGVRGVLDVLPGEPLGDAELGAFAPGTPGRMEHPAYVIYTSGSTGRPKGVVTAYRGLTNMQLNHRAEIFDPAVARARATGRERLRIAHTVSFSFDMSWEELLWLVEGHEVHICDEELRRDATALVAYCRDHRIDVINVTPTYAHALFEEGLLDGPGHAPCLVLLGGEAVGDAVWSRLSRPGGPRGYNLYGPTEYTINTLGAGTDDSATPTVGRPIWNTRAYVLDPWLRPVPDGVPGELYISGIGLAHGYLHAPDLTAARFVADPFVPGGRMYRTGDLVRLRPDGNLDFLGRTDDQVKIRGYRVELGEIESALTVLPGVRQAAVIARPDATVPGLNRLVAYIVPAASEPDPADLPGRLRAALAEKLPGYMVPALYGVVPELPLTVNGKLDTAALPEPTPVGDANRQGPRDERERLLCGIYADVLGLPEVGIDDDFFAIGGDSISSITVSGRARRAGLPVTPRDVFRRRTVRALAAACAEAAPPTPATAAGDDGTGAIALTPMLAETVQARTPLDNFYQAMTFHTPADLDLPTLRRMLQALGERHDLLRARIARDGDRDRDRWTLTVPPATEFRADDLVRRMDPVFYDAVGEITRKAAARLDPERGVMLQAIWFASAASADAPVRGRLLLVIHHLVIDGVSWRVIADDLARAWEQTRRGEEPVLDEVPTSFQTWAELFRDAAERGVFRDELDHWRDVLATDDPPLGRRPLDPATDTAATVRSLTFTLPPDVSAALLSSAPAAMHGGVNDVLLTGLAVALAEWRRAPHRLGDRAGTAVPLSLEGHGRDADPLAGPDHAVDVSRTIGWFTAIHPVRLDPGQLPWTDVLAAGPALAHAAKTVKEQLRAVPRRGMGYGVLRYLDDTIPADGWPDPPQILFNYLGRFPAGTDADWSPASPLTEGVDPANPAMGLEINALAQDGPGATTTFSATLSWPGGTMTEADVSELADLWSAALTALTRCADLAGHTPSDFPLVTLSQQDVDRLAPPGGGTRDILPLLPLQQGMYFHSSFADPGADTYVVQQIAELSGPVSPAALRRAVAAAVRRHDALRACFRETADGRVVQVIADDADVPWREFDLRGLSPEDAAGRLAEIGAAELAEPFDLASAPLVRYALVTLGDTDHRLVETMHHIIADGWSYPLVFADIVEAYEHEAYDHEAYDHEAYDHEAYERGRVNPAGRLDLPAPAVTFRDHVEAVTGRDRRRDLEVWRAALTGVTPTRLIDGSDRQRVSRHKAVSVALPPERVDALSRAVRDRGVTLSTFVHGAWGLLLGLMLGREQVVFGSTVSGRGGALPGVESIVGLLINTIPAPMEWRPGDRLGEILDRLQERQIDLLDAQHVGLTELARLAGVREFFDTMVVVENFPAVRDSADTTLRVLGFTGTDAPHYPVSLVAFPAEGRLTLELKYDVGLVAEAEARRLLDRVVHVLDHLITSPDLPVADLNLLTGDERAIAFSGALPRPNAPARNGRLAPARATTITARPGALPAEPARTLPGALVAEPLPVADDATLAAAFAAIARRHPRSAAVTYEGTELTYGELDEAANRLARALIARGVRPESRVAVALPRSAELIVALLAVLKAGGCYVPLDAGAPAARLHHILRDSAPVCLLTDRSWMRDTPLADTSSVPVVALDDPEVAGFSGAPLDAAETQASAGNADNAAYVIYTSGSTGQPKGVPVTHRNVLSLFAGAAELFDFGPSDVWTMFHSYAFDFSVWEMWGALLYGGRLVVVGQDVARDPTRFRTLLERERVTVLNQTPSAFYPLIEADRTHPGELALRYIVFGGEALDLARLAPWYRRHADTAPLLVNMYGITETCVHVSFRPLTSGEPTGGAPSVIGGPLPGLGVYVLDHRLRPVPPGVTGELYVAGDQLARGYLDRPGLTASRFVADPFSDRPGGRLYRSGDLARWTPEGDLVYLGRSDRQVKVRGYRIELGEIESALLSLDGVANAAVDVREDEPGRRRLVAYVVGRDGVTVDAQTARAHLSKLLPGYMVPSAFVPMTSLPLTVNGKLDRNALPAPPTARSTVTADPTRTDRADTAPANTDRVGTGRAHVDPVHADRTGAVSAFADHAHPASTDPAHADRADAAPAADSGRTNGHPGMASAESSATAVLCELYAQVLHLDVVGPDEDFFALGGDSIIAIQLVNLARRRSLRLSPREVFLHRTPAAIVAALNLTEADYAEPPSRPGDSATQTGPGTGFPAGPLTGAAGSGREAVSDGIGEVMLMPIVHRLAELGGRISRLNQAELLLTPPGITADQVRAMINALVERHDALRLRLDRPSPLLWSLRTQALGEAPAPVLTSVNATGLDDDALRERIAAESDAAADALDPDEGHMLRVVWFDRGDLPGRLLLVAHHLVVDGVSWRILVDDLRQAWDDLTAGRPIRLDPVGTSLRAYARTLNEHAAQAARLAEFDHWATALAPGGELDPDARTFGLTVGATRDHVLRLPPKVTARLLTTVPAAARADVTETLVAALHLAVSRRRAARGGPADAPLLIDVERHGREQITPDVDLSRTVGWFTAISPVRLPPPPANPPANPSALIGEVSRAMRAAPDGGLGFGLLRYCNPRSAPALARLAVPQLLFNYLGRFPTGRTGDWEAAPEADALRTSPDPDLGTPYLLEINAACHDTPAGPELHAVLTYADGGLDRREVEALADAWAAALRELADGPAPGPLTPRDLPHIALTQEEIDRALAATDVAVHDIWPLSPLQEGLFFQARYAGDADVYIARNTFDFAGRLDADALARAYGRVLERHAAMRLGFTAEGLDRPVALVGADLRHDIEVIDLSASEGAAFAARLDEIVQADRRRPFALAEPPLCRLTVIRLPDGRDRLLLTYHLLLWDGWSRELVLRDLFGRYAEERGLPHGESAEPRAEFTDYLDWLARQDADASARAWADALAGVEPTVLFPVPDGTPPVQPAGLSFQLTAEQTERVVVQARRCGVTLNAMLSTALGLVLSHASGRPEAVFGTTVAGRPTELDGIDTVVGVFLNTVPARVRLAPGETALDVMRRVQADRVAMMPHEYLGLGDIQRAAGRGQLFDSLYVLQNFLDDDTFTDLEEEHGIVDVRAVDATHYPLTWVATPGRRLTVRLEHRTDVVPPERAEALLARLRRVLLHLAESPTALVADVPVTLPEEQAALAAEWDAAGHRIGEATIAELMAAQAARTPDAPALTFGADTITYAELDARVNRLARLLLAHGAGPEKIVALALPRSIEMVVALFAVLRAGAAYLPLELDHPDDRLLTMIADAQPIMLVTTGAVAPRLLPTPAPRRTASAHGPADRTAPDQGAPATVLCLDAPDVAARLLAMRPDPIEDGEVPAFAPGTPGRLDLPAYVIYTSGSTGRPKGVVTPYRGLTNMQLNHREAIFGPTIAAAGGRTLTIAHTVSFSFDMSWEELLWLVEGHHVHICDEELRRDAPALVAYCDRHRIDVVNVTPTYAGHLLDQGLLYGERHGGPPGSHRPVLVLLGGEAVPQALWTTLRDADGVLGYNLYGPTEYTINTLGAGTTDSATTTVGRPIWNTRGYVLDPWLRPVPVGVPGELYISGAGLARGYLRRPALTAERFVADPFAPGGRMYRTGDLVRRRPDGNLDFLGRTDDQVKIRGYRVELGEIETALAALPEVRQCAVLAVPDSGGGKRLVAYIVPSPDVSHHADELLTRVQRALKAVLPGYMVPSAYALVDTLPLTINGKLDVAALPTPRPVVSRSRPPADERERRLCELFAEALDLGEGETVGGDDDFFDLGGHSLIAIRLLSLIRTTLDAELSLRDLFDARTPARLAARLAIGGEPVRPKLTRRERPGGHPPLSAAQERLWLLHQLDPGSTAYNYPLLARLHGRVDADALRAALDDVVARHEVLRTVITVVGDVPTRAEGSHLATAEHGDPAEAGLPPADGPTIGHVPVQRVLPPPAIHPTVVRCPAERTADIVAEAVARPFDLSQDVPLRVTVVEETDTGDTVLALVLHHIAMDEWSDGPLLRDLDTAYAARLAGRAPEWEPLPVQYADYAHWQGELLGDPGDPGSRAAIEQEYWLRTLHGLPDEIALPADRPRPLHGSRRAGQVDLQLPPELIDPLRRLAQAESASLFMALHAALATLLSRLGAGTDVPIGAPASGRADAALADLVGFFVNTVVLRTDLSGSPSFTELLQRVRENDLAAFEHATLPFQQVVEAVNPARAQGRNPLFQVMLGFLQRPGGRDTLLGLPVGEAPSFPADAKVDLNFTFVDAGPGEPVALNLEYDTDRFDHGTARRLTDRLAVLLGEITLHPERRVDEFTPLSAQDLDDLARWQSGGPLHADGTPWHIRFSEWARRTPDADACVFDGRTLSYAALDAAATEFAARLTRLGAGPGDLVGLALPRSAGLLIAVLGVAKSGAAYLPLDPDFPPERLRFMVADAHPEVIVVEYRTRDLFRDHATQARLIDLSRPGTGLGAAPDFDTDDMRYGAAELTRPLADTAAKAGVSTRDSTNTEAGKDAGMPTGIAPATEPRKVADTTRHEPDAPAYVIYTSGSTGRPKGVVVARHELETFLSAVQTAAPIGEHDRLLAVTTLSFDISVLELMAPLRAGGCVILASERQVRDPWQLAHLIQAERATVMQATPSLWAALLESTDADLSDVRALVGGEALPLTLARDLAARARSVTNLYGPTEVTVWATAATIDPALTAQPSIGRPFPGTTAYVLDEKLRPTPPGVPGELYLGGAQVTQGYLDRPGLTASRFLPNPFATAGQGTRMYRTGDLARWRAEGTLEFLGRADHQVKVRGFRIEPGEIETVAEAHPEIARAVVVVRRDERGDGHILGYVTTTNGEATVPASLAPHLAERLPAYMIPAAVTALEALPLTPNGKVDRATLPDVEFGGMTGRAEPRTRTEAAVCAVMAQVLGLDTVGVDDDFFALGGHSLLLVRLAALLRRELGAALSIADLFTTPTPAAVARRLTEEAPSAEVAMATLLPLRTGGDRPPLFCFAPASGLGWQFAGLKRHLPDDIPLYALQSPRLSRTENLPTTMADLAAEYADLIDQVAPDGPVTLLGWSFGGAVAHMTAVRLAAEGREVPFLGMLDTRAEFPERAPGEWDGPAALVALLTEMGYRVPDDSRDSRDTLSLADAVTIVRDGGGAVAGLDDAQIARVVENYLASDHMMEHAEYAVFPGDALVVDAAVPEQGFTGTASDQWRDHIAGTLHVHAIDCAHSELLDVRTLETLGPLLARYLTNLTSRRSHAN